MCKSKGVQPQGEALVSLLHMKPEAILPCENLSSWYFAIRWARLNLEQDAEHMRQHGWDTSYTDDNVKKLLQVEAFLNSSWDAYMEWLQSPLEVSSDA
jgi:hypothetical protein